jgi:hypothetical protein
MSGQGVAVRRKILGQVDSEQEQFICAMLTGCYSVSHAADKLDLSKSTCEKWMRLQSPVRRELERRLSAKNKIFDALVKLVDDPKATPYLRLEASRELMAWMKLSPPDRERQRHESAPSRELIRLLKLGRDEPEGDRAG